MVNRNDHFGAGRSIEAMARVEVCYDHRYQSQFVFILLLYMSNAFKIHKQGATYFLTLQVVYWVDVFSRKRYRDIVAESLNFCVKEKGLNVFAYVIMSNHVHLMVNAAQQNLSDVVRDLKTFTSKQIMNSILNEPESRREWMLKLFAHAASGHQRNENYQLWTHENHAEEIYSPKFTHQRINYIHENPVRAGLVEKAEEYLYSSARDYAGKKGLVSVEVLNLHLMMA
jgi:REP element-mobilizing transposase RayT